jgi:PKHD-type hydroxylase
MHLVLPEVLSEDDVAGIVQMLAHAPPGESWIDGTATSGTQSRGVKSNQQMPENGRVTAHAREVLVAALNRHPLFMMAALPRKLYPPNFNRYMGAANQFGDHIDNALRRVSGTNGYLRCDLSCTVFLSDPASYEGGELVVQIAGREVRHKLQAGDAILYPAGSIHRVEPVTRGERIASFFWVESMVRDTEQRETLYDLDLTIQRLRAALGETRECVALTQTYHRLMRLWATS